MILLQLIGLTFIIVMGFKIIMSKGMLFENVGNYFERKLDEGNKWPDLFYCQWCMPTLCSLIAHLFAIGLDVLPKEWNWKLLIREPLVVMGSSFLCGNVWNIYETINRIREKNEAEANYFKNLFGDEPIEK